MTRTRKEHIWCEVTFDGYQAKGSGELHEVGLGGRYVGTFQITHRWPARVRGEGMVQISARVLGDPREWTGRYSPNGTASGHGSRIIIRPKST